MSDEHARAAAEANWERWQGLRQPPENRRPHSLEVTRQRFGVHGTRPGRAGTR